MKTFTAACREFFGFRPGTSLSEFGAELKALTYADKLEIAVGLRANGIECEDPIKPA